MLITDSTQVFVPKNRPQAAQKQEPQQDAPSSKDSVEVDFSGRRPAHRNVKKMARGMAGVVGLAGLGKAAYDIATASSVADAALKTSINVALTAGGVLAIDLGSGVAHHWGDNYGLPNPKPLDHTKWHTDTDDSNYCLVGLSNGALEKIDFWPKWERAVHAVTGKEPLSWKVEPYRQYVAGEMDKATLEQRLDGLGINRPQ